MHTFYLPDVASGYLDPEESKHAIKVLRLAGGDEIELTDGKGSFYTSRIIQPDPRRCTFKILQKNSIPRRCFSIHLAIAPTKNADRMEWMVEKCVEIGVEHISFLLCKTSERKSVNLERLEKVAISAMKQSRQAWLPTVSDIIPFKEFVDGRNESLKFIAFVDEKNPDQLKNLAAKGSDSLVLIGPEGDFTNEELASAIASGFKKVSLGPNRLRTETAGLVAVTCLNQINA